MAGHNTGQVNQLLEQPAIQPQSATQQGATQQAATQQGASQQSSTAPVEPPYGYRLHGWRTQYPGQDTLRCSPDIYYNESSRVPTWGGSFSATDRSLLTQVKAKREAEKARERSSTTGGYFFGEPAVRQSQNQSRRRGRGRGRGGNDSGRDSNQAHRGGNDSFSGQSRGAGFSQFKDVSVPNNSSATRWQNSMVPGRPMAIEQKSIRPTPAAAPIPATALPWTPSPMQVPSMMSTTLPFSTYTHRWYRH
ncbi:hypothetical protein LTR09_011208 [Extremus antarcticus]|uniref:Uncharacterized protein n=1 Tax=Extremus antarcticus TaxID=702011 RepID=A0AAJ0DC47_9PEZI|nr:hypothetical protein LTR09_011208 [Extremus antarcticus]